MTWNLFCDPFIDRQFSIYNLLLFLSLARETITPKD